MSDIGDSLADGVSIIKALSVSRNNQLMLICNGCSFHHVLNHLQHASKKKPPKFNPNPKLPLHRQDNWKMAHEYMKELEINVRGIEPAGMMIYLPK